MDFVIELAALKRLLAARGNISRKVAEQLEPVIHPFEPADRNSIPVPACAASGQGRTKEPHDQRSMTERETRRSSEPATPKIRGCEFVKFGTKRIETLIQVQKQLVEPFEHINREQLARANQQTELAAQLTDKLICARSIPDIPNARQECISKRMAGFTEDGRNCSRTARK
jgi:hypothetical protein